MCRPKHVEQLRNIGIINSTTRLHLVGSFYEIDGRWYVEVVRLSTLHCSVVDISVYRSVRFAQFLRRCYVIASSGRYQSSNPSLATQHVSVKITRNKIMLTVFTFSLIIRIFFPGGNYGYWQRAPKSLAKPLDK